jgi:hypothetical protein
MTQRRRVQKLRTHELEEKRRDRWFNQEGLMVGANKTWKEKRIEKEEQGSDVGNDRGGIGEQDVTAVNMVFQLPDEFMLLETEVAQLDLGAERAVFKKPAAIGRHMKPFYVKGHIDGVPINRLLIDGGACVNIMPSSVFKRLGHTESELMKTNMTLNGFSGEASDAKGIVAKELTIRGKMAPTSFFMVNVKGKYNALLGRDWIHANGCVPSTLHQCLIQWVGVRFRLRKQMIRSAWPWLSHLKIHTKGRCGV